MKCFQHKTIEITMRAWEKIAHTDFCKRKDRCIRTQLEMGEGGLDAHTKKLHFHASK